jgi:four helix bundle protein
MSNYENLKVWQKAIELAVKVYKTTAENKFFQKDFSLRDQVRRSAVSISSNISEGDQLGSDRQAIRQFYIAKGSTAELFTQVTISGKIGYLTDSESKFLKLECISISAMLTNLIKARRKTKDEEPSE